MDETHREFVDALDELLACEDADHAAVMKSVGWVLQAVRQGDVAEGRRLAAALADWFPGHAFHLDSALAHWMVKRSYGGKPVVLRRRATSGS